MCDALAKISFNCRRDRRVNSHLSDSLGRLAGHYWLVSPHRIRPRPMSISRSESQYSRRRSNTTQSAYKNTHPPPPPLEVGASKVLIVWVHSTSTGDCSVILNHSYLPGVAPGDLLSVTTTQLHDKSGFLFLVPNEDPNVRAPLQVRVIFTFPLAKETTTP